MLGSCRQLAVAFCLAVLLSGQAGAADGFLTGIPDLPLMDGLTEIDAAGVVFDTPEGRIVRAMASGPVRRAAVLRFYAGALPQLGWRAIGGRRFEREGERLELELADQAGGLTVRFSLSPHASSTAVIEGARSNGL